MAPNDFNPLEQKSEQDLRRIAGLLDELVRFTREEREEKRVEKEERQREARQAASVLTGDAKNISQEGARLIAHAEANQTAKSQGFQNADDMARAQGYGRGWNEMYAEQMRNARGAGTGFTGAFNRVTGYQFATGTGTSSALYGISQSMSQKGFIGGAYRFGESLYSAFTPNYVSNALVQNLSSQERAALLYRDRMATTEVALANIDPDTLTSPAERKAFKMLLDPSITHRERGKAISVLQDRILASGSDISPLKESSNAVVRGLANTVVPEAEGAAGMMAMAGKGLMMGARFANPVLAAIQIGQMAYGITKDYVYAPARSAASLGYGFSYNPLSQGAQVSLGRSVQTNLDAMFSMGLSGAQTAAARQAIEGMGIGGPGSEKTYDAYYKSMTSVMENTQLDSKTLAPFYERFMRSGGSADEVGKLTSLLRDELPQAAAASRMSMSQLADSISKTVEAVQASPLNARTSTQITEAAMVAANAGGFKSPGLQNIASGLQTNINVMASTQSGIPYNLVRNYPGLLLNTAVDQVGAMLGQNLTVEEFDQKILTDQGFGIKVSMLKSMYGLTPDDIRNLYSVGLNDYKNSGSIAQTFTGRMHKVGPKRWKDKEESFWDSLGYISGEHYSGKHSGQEQVQDVFISQPGIAGGKKINLSQTSASRLTSLYGGFSGGQVDVLRSGVKATHGNLEEFNKRVRELSMDKSAGSAIEAEKYFENVKRHLLEKMQQTGDQTKVIIQADGALKKLLTMRFGSKYGDTTPTNNDTTQGGVRLEN